MESRTSRTFGSRAAPSLVDIIERSPMEKSRPSPLEWWYRMTAPPEPPANATLKQREAHRRGRLISLMLLMQIVIDLIVVFTVGLFVTHLVILTAGIPILFLLFGGWLNQRGRVLASGIIVVAALDAGLFGVTLNYNGGLLSSFALPFFDLLVLTNLFAVSLLPENMVFLAAFVNILFIGGTVLWMPKTTELNALLHSPSIADVIVRPVVLQIGATIVSYLWVRSAKRALERADRATTIATLEHTLAQQGQQIAQQKQQLEQSIQQIVDTHMRVANGDYSARVPLNQDNVLWQVAGLLNNALARLQHLQQTEAELQQVQQAVDYLGEAMRRSNGAPIPWPQTGTLFDTLVLQHNALAQQYNTLAQQYDKLTHAYSERQRWQQ